MIVSASIPYIALVHYNHDMGRDVYPIYLHAAVVETSYKYIILTLGCISEPATGGIQ